jgi:nicotinamide riboside kinase
LARALAEHFDVPWVAEVAREHLLSGARSDAGYDAAKLDQIARAQLDAEIDMRASHQGLLILDTDLLVIDIWWRERFGKPPRWLVGSLASTAPGPQRRYLLCPPDLPWEADPLRENPHDRERLYDLYRGRLTELGASYQVISGAGAGRSAAAISAIDGWLDIS